MNDIKPDEPNEPENPSMEKIDNDFNEFHKQVLKEGPEDSVDEEKIERFTDIANEIIKINEDPEIQQQILDKLKKIRSTKSYILIDSKVLLKIIVLHQSEIPKKKINSILKNILE
jgi:hypothetical protein